MTLALQTNVQLGSEVGRLTHVCLHRPGFELLVPPKRAVEWLFEDIVDLQKTQEQHDQIWQILDRCGVTTYDSQTLLAETFRRVPATRQWLVHRIGALESISPDTERSILELGDAALAEVCVTGIRIDDRAVYTRGLPDRFTMIFRPLPNLMFTRDMGAVVNRHIILSQAAKEIRKREALIYRTIFYHHPDFHEVPRLEPWGRPDDPVTIEGGDVLVLSEQHLAIGVSERTNDGAVKWLIERLFEHRVVEGVFAVHLPKDRGTMHLDTIFTAINHREYLAYAPLIASDTEQAAPVTYYARRNTQPTSYPSLDGALRQQTASSRHLAPTLIWCADRLPIHEDREQWVDAVNSLAIAPGVIIVYQRNPFTLEALRREGYTIISCAQFLETHVEMVNPLSFGKTAITIEGSELCRARGGPHCLTMPLRREPI